MRKSVPDYGATTSASDSCPISKKHFDQARSRMLRSRLGGGLRANENVHDLELRRPKSTGSIATCTGTMQSSMLICVAIVRAVEISKGHYQDSVLLALWGIVESTACE